MQPHSNEQTADSKLRFFGSMTLDSNGVVRGGFSPIFTTPIMAAPTKPTSNTNCKGANCGNCTICPPAKPK